MPYTRPFSEEYIQRWIDAFRSYRYAHRCTLDVFLFAPKRHIKRADERLRKWRDASDSHNLILDWAPEEVPETVQIGPVDVTLSASHNWN